MYPLAVLFIACELCQHVNGAFNECSDIVDQFGWYRFPAEVKQILPIILSFTQQPVVIKCFGSITCDRETFKYVSGHWPAATDCNAFESTFWTRILHLLFV